ncbi:hypothetical protein [Photobacterium phosphoreum]|uniref:hypothetical protein n=1 Tax=Photobacterium phosphoreum TaxID=659 RepID=UPI001E4FA1F2|nr:hypothetical protein [Photobacterium phosphoreum]MCD9509518.1 hypothetical protein [Photobacterium phosphoreum]
MTGLKEVFNNTMLTELSNIWGNRLKKWENLKETFSYFSASTELESCIPHDTHLLKILLTSLNTHQDNIVIKLFVCNNTESYEFSNRMSPNNFDKKAQEVIDEIDCLDEGDINEVSLHLEINKKISKNKTNTLIDHIYSINTWSEYLQKLSLENLHYELSKRYHQTNIEKVIILGDFSTAINTDYFHFIPKNESLDKIKSRFSNYRAIELIKLRSSLGHFANASEWPFLPDHFKFNNYNSNEFEIIFDVFNALHNAYLISFIANFTVIKGGKVEYTLKGLKNITEEYDLISLKKINASPLWRLYEWIYQSNTVDKIGISRNIIPLHANTLLSVNDAVLTSSYSSFNLSQKDDVKSYIEATNKLSDQVISTSQKASDIAAKVANSMKTGIWGVGAFTISTILFRIFAKGIEITTFQGVFDLISSPIFILVILLTLIIFSISFFLTIYESYSDQKRFKEIYEDTKKVYQNVLTKDDIDNILSNDECFLKDYNFISIRRTLYIKIWAMSIFIILLLMFII